MPDRPYSIEDLRAQADLYMDEVDVNPLTVLVDMTEEAPWCGLGTDDFNDAHTAVMALINDAAIPEEGS